MGLRQSRVNPVAMGDNFELQKLKENVFFIRTPFYAVGRFLNISNQTVVFLGPEQRRVIVVNPSNVPADTFAAVKQQAPAAAYDEVLLISPCDKHGLFLPKWVDAMAEYRRTHVYVAPLKHTLLEDPKIAALVSDASKCTVLDVSQGVGAPLIPALEPDFSVLVIKGLQHHDVESRPDRHELFFYHAPSQTATCGDMFNYSQRWSLVPALMGVTAGRVEFLFALSRATRKIVRDKAAAVASVKDICSKFLATDEPVTFVPCHLGPYTVKPARTILLLSTVHYFLRCARHLYTGMPSLSLPTSMRLPLPERFACSSNSFSTTLSFSWRSERPRYSFKVRFLARSSERR